MASSLAQQIREFAEIYDRRGATMQPIKVVATRAAVERQLGNDRLFTTWETGEMFYSLHRIVLVEPA